MQLRREGVEAVGGSESFSVRQLYPFVPDFPTPRRPAWRYSAELGAGSWELGLMMGRGEGNQHGAVLLLVDGDNGELLRLTPSAQAQR